MDNRFVVRERVNRQAGLRYRAWLELFDLSTELTLAGLKAQGHSAQEALEIFRKRWERGHQEHLSADQRILKQLAFRDRVSQPKSR